MTLAAHEEYEFNPVTDRIVYGDEITDDMLVMPEDPFSRRYGGWGRNDKRSQEFARVTKLKRTKDHIRFIGVWPDGFQQSYVGHAEKPWIVYTKKKVRSPNESRFHLGEKPWFDQYLEDNYQYDLKHAVRSFGLNYQ